MRNNVCWNCFQELENSIKICPYCGYNVQKVKNYPLSLPCGTILSGRYIVGRVLGQGGFGITYMVQDHKTKTREAIKEYFPDAVATRVEGGAVSSYSSEKEESFQYGKARFLEEAKTLAEFVENPHIVKVYSYFEENNTAYFVMELVEGISFQQYLEERGGVIKWDDAFHILAPVMDALSAVHMRGIVHRDVKPDNIFLSKDGTVRLLDFGSARYSLGEKSRSLDVLLTHGFAPWEQYSRHSRQGAYTDIYSLAATFYYAVTGYIPPDSVDRVNKDTLVPPRQQNPDIPAQAADALQKALAVYPEDRFQNMKAFRWALEDGMKLDHKRRVKTSLVQQHSSSDRTATGKYKLFVSIVVLLSIAAIAFAYFQMVRGAAEGSVSESAYDTYVATAVDDSKSIEEADVQKDQHQDKDDHQLVLSEGEASYQYTTVEGRDSGIISNGYNNSIGQGQKND